MNGSLRLIFILFASVILGYIAIKFVISLALSLILMALPVLVIGALGYGVYSYASGKSILGVRRRTLP
jgi:hypothetical protein